LISPAISRVLPPRYPENTSWLFPVWLGSISLTNALVPPPAFGFTSRFALFCCWQAPALRGKSDEKVPPDTKICPEPSTAMPVAASAITMKTGSEMNGNPLPPKYVEYTSCSAPVIEVSSSETNAFDPLPEAAWLND
jgi:hypothetical protein